jgi:1-acyl-sn-glycerol-3-phosphate acyltransferase
MTTPTLLKPLNAAALLRLFRGILLVAPWIVWLFLSDVALSLLLPVSFVAPNTAYHLSSKIAYLVWRWLQAIFTNANGARITISGSHLPQQESALVVANHVDWVDIFAVQHLAIKAGMLSRCRWFAKQQLKWVPFLGWGLWAMGMPLISRQWDKDQKELDRVFKGPKQRRWPICEF